MKWIGAKIFFERLFLKKLDNPGSDTDKFLVADQDGEIGFRTGAELLSDIGSGDITGVTIQTDSGSGSKASDNAGSADFILQGGEGMNVTNSGATITVAGEDASTSNKGVASFASADFGVASGAVSLGDDVVKDISTDSGAVTPATHTVIISGGEGIDTSGADDTITISAEDATTSNKGVASFNTDHFTVISGAVSLKQTQIKVLPHHFMSNEDGGANKSAQFRDDTIIGVRATHNDAELYAFVEIPVGHTATSVTVYGNDTSLDVLVYESDINAGALTDKTHASGCTVGSACDITDVAADGTNYLVIKVAIASYTNDIVYGATVTITATG